MRSAIRGGQRKTTRPLEPSASLSRSNREIIIIPIPAGPVDPASNLRTCGSDELGIVVCRG